MIGHGCIYEHNISCFARDDFSKGVGILDPANKSQSSKIEINYDYLTSKDARIQDTRTLMYMKKFAAGKIIGLQNLIPIFQEKT